MAALLTSDSGDFSEELGIRGLEDVELRGRGLAKGVFDLVERTFEGFGEEEEAAVKLGVLEHCGNEKNAVFGLD
ncbi:hypothetical protein L596_028953 [Steinernema carpocapsae]|uniref:Uncharacterized protein n=1 Tax=Steinernema carpocapsae TaxID=34508 RepID=A0A4U5LT71_STECR|nr:hypothetical protein L596_028953 [Steinernema carpocapsae]